MGKKPRSKKRRKSQLNQGEISQFSAYAGGSSFPQKTLVLILLFLVLTLGIILRVNNLWNVPQRSPDENIYTYQGKIIAQQGIKGSRLLVRQFNMDKYWWIYPPPTRVGYLFLLAGVMKMTNSMDVKAGVYVSCFFSILTLLLIIVLGLKFFNRWITLYALLFMSVSPMGLAVARRSWQEALIGYIGLLLIYFCCEITRGTHRIIWYILFVAIGSYCMLIKETGTLIYALCMAWFLWVLFIREKSLSKGVVLIAFASLGAGISLAFFVHATGGILALKQVLINFKQAMQTNVYPQEYASGPWYHFFGLLWILSPLSTILFFIGGIGTILFNDADRKITVLPIDKSRSPILGIIFFMAAFMAVLFLAKEHSLNLRYVGVLYAPFYLISGLGFWYIILFAKKMFKNFSFSVVIACVIAVVIFAAASDYQNFKKIIVNSGIKDLSIRLIRESAP